MDDLNWHAEPELFHRWSYVRLEQSYIRCRGTS